MRTPAPLITALALGALVTPALSAQSATDLAEVCKTLGNAKVGQWASFEGTSASGGGKLRLAVVGSERAADSTFYWFEVNFAGQEPGKSGVVQILAPNLASGSAAPRSLIVKLGPQPAMRISGQMAGMMGQNPGKDNSAFDWASRCSGAHVVGWESVTGSHVLPPSVLLKTPPPVVPNQYSLGRAAEPATATLRPPRKMPISRQVRPANTVES